VLEALDSGFDVAITSRFQTGSQCRGVPTYRRTLSASASAFLRGLFPTPGVRDFTCGYRASVLRRAMDEYGDTLVEFDGFQ
jgi:dolichol-phosphate mannosyltransferase